MKKRTVLTVLAAAAMTLQLFGSGGVAHGQTPPPEVTFSFVPTDVTQGAKVTFTGTGCPHKAGETTRDGVFIVTPNGTTGKTVDFLSNDAGVFSGELDTTSLAPGTYITLVTCLNTGKQGPGSPLTVRAPVIVGSTYNPLTPARILDTRNGTGTGGGTNPVGQASTIELKVTEVGNVPAANVTAVALNVTATGATGPASFMTVYPTGSTRPLASNLNFNVGTSIPNLVVARVGTGGKVSIYNNLGSIHVVADVQGYYTDAGGVTGGSTFVPVNPLRLLDTRTGTGATQAKVPPGGTIELTVTGQGGVPATGATAVALNMTTTEATGPESFLTVWPAGQSRPTVSNLNFSSGLTSTNAVMVRVGDGGKVAIYNNLGSTEIVADLNGWFAAPVATGTTPPGQFYFPLNPVRALDSRNGTGTPGGESGQLGTGRTIDVPISGVGGVPSSATGAILNVTAADSPGPDSFLTVFPSGTPRPLASNLNFVAGQTVPNLVSARLGNGRVAVYNNLGSVAVIADIQGYYAPQGT